MIPLLEIPILHPSNRNLIAPAYYVPTSSYDGIVILVAWPDLSLSVQIPYPITITFMYLLTFFYNTITLSHLHK